jgi:hypothetical protein
MLCACTPEGVLHPFNLWMQPLRIAKPERMPWQNPTSQS